ncbi:MAG: carboxypeptidase regulatory-like domain-containing protein [Acidimicrobiia bacterium]
MRDSTMKNDSRLIRGSVARILFGSGAVVSPAVAATASIVLATAALAPSVASAQDFTNATASGRVQGTDGKAIAGAVVEYKSNAQGFVRSVRTDESGAFRLVQLPTGSYTVTVKADGYDQFTDSDVMVTIDRAANRFTLASATNLAEVVVTAGRVQISDFERTTVGAVINVADLAANMPVARDITSVVQLAPGTTFGDTAFGNLPNIAGGSVAENQYYINGLNITEFREGLGAVTVPFEFYETVEVKSGGFPAEFGRTTGGVVNATTRSGSNDFKFSALVNWESDSLRSKAKDTVFSENSREFADRLNTNITASGPIIEDRLFFFALYEQRKVESSNTVTGYSRIGTTANFNQVGSTYTKSKTDSPFMALKIDAIPFEGHRLELTYFDSSGESITDSYRYNAYKDVSNGTVAGFVPGRGAYTNTAVSKYGGENYVGRYTATFTDWFTASAAYGKNEYLDTLGTTDDNLPSVFDARTSQSGGNSVVRIDFSYDEREFVRADFDLRFDLLGSHHVRAGYDREDLTTDSTTRYTGGVSYTINNSGPAGDNNVKTPNTNYVAGRFFLNGGVFESQNEALYLQDSWSLLNDRLTLQIGARNDRFTNENAAGEVFSDSGDNWAPRFGVSFDPQGDGGTKLYGSLGRYFLPIAANTNIRLAGSELDYTRYNLLAGQNADKTPVLGAAILGVPGARACQDTKIVNCVFTADGEPTPTDATVSKTLKAQAVDEWIIGGERRLSDGWKVGLYYTHRELVRALEDAAIDAAVNQFCVDNKIASYEACSSTFSGFHQYVLINPGQNAVITLSDPLPGEKNVRTISFTAAQLGYPKATRDYDALTFQFEREFDGKWSIAGSYTNSILKGNYEGAVKSDNGQTDAGLTTDFDQPGLTFGTDGLSPNHRKHNFKLYGNYKVNDLLMVSANYSLSSPRLFGCIGRIPASVDFFAQFYGAAGFYCNVDSTGSIITDERVAVNTNSAGKLTPRASVFESDWRQQLNLSFILNVPTQFLGLGDRVDAKLRADVFNVFNNQMDLDFEERGTQGNGRPRNTYQQVVSRQSPRSFRLQFSVNF